MQSFSLRCCCVSCLAIVQTAVKTLAGTFLAEVFRVKLKLSGAGFGRTGTSSTKLALEMLGWGPCHHMSAIRENPAPLPDWSAAARGEAMDWDRVFKGFASQLDWPGARYWRELTAHFPNAKVILNYRDPDEWYDSLRMTIIPSASIGRKADPNPHTRAMAEMVYPLGGSVSGHWTVKRTRKRQPLLLIVIVLPVRSVSRISCRLPATGGK